MAVLTIVRPGIMTTVQDGGRQGVQAWGVTPGGAVDDVALRVGNAIVGNSPTAAALEMTWQGAHIAFATDTLIAVTGAALQWQDGMVPGWRPLWVKAGTTLAFGAVSNGARSYLCVQGGIGVRPVLGARGADIRNGFGGGEGRPLRAGDLLPIAAQEKRYAGLFHAMQANDRTYVCPSWQVSVWRDWPGPAVLPMIPGDACASLTDPMRQRLFSREFTIAPASDRQGLRLQGVSIESDLPRQTSAGVCFGLIQLPPDGNPIVLLADHQTTGGYPVLGVVAAVARSRLAQARPGDTLRFTPSTLGDAHASLWRREQRLQGLQRMLSWQMRQ